jgi:hypothetical protein
VLPNGGGSLGFDYLDAFDKTALGVLACPIGMAYFAAEPWSDVGRLFMGRPAARYVNVVCAPPNLLMGQRLRASDAPVLGSDGEVRAIPSGKTESIIYEPQTALAGLYTVGVPNVAITMARPRPPEDHEIRALAQYDAVLCPSSSGTEELQRLGVVAMHVPADAEQLKRLVGWLLR